MAAFADQVRLVGLRAVQGVAVLVREDRDRRQVELVGGTEGPDRDLAPVGDEQLAEHGTPRGGGDRRDDRNRAHPFGPGAAVCTSVRRMYDTPSAAAGRPSRARRVPVPGPVCAHPPPSPRLAGRLGRDHRGRAAHVVLRGDLRPGARGRDARPRPARGRPAGAHPAPRRRRRMRLGAAGFAPLPHHPPPPPRPVPPGPDAVWAHAPGALRHAARRVRRARVRPDVGAAAAGAVRRHGAEHRPVRRGVRRGAGARDRRVPAGERTPPRSSRRSSVPSGRGARPATPPSASGCRTWPRRSAAPSSG